MALLFPTTLSGASNRLTLQATVEVWINSVYRPDARVDHISQKEGLRATEATVLFEGAWFEQYPVAVGDTVIIYINRAWFPLPFFRGRIENPSSNIEVGSQSTSYIAIDDRATLYDGACDRNYNELDEQTQEMVVNPTTNKVPLEPWTTAEIVADILAQYHDNGGSLFFSTSGADLSMAAGTQELKGMPFGEALQTLLESAGNGRLRVKLRYTSSSGQLEIFSVGSGFQKRTVRGTLYSADANAQPEGAANVGRATRTRLTTESTTKLTVNGSRLRYETAVVLTPWWDVDGSKTGVNQATVIAGWEKYTREGTEKEPNTDFVKGAEFVGRRFRIPKISDTCDDATRSRQVKPLPECLQDFWLPDADGNTAKAPPIVVAKFGAVYKVFHSGFSLEDDKTVSFEKPAIEVARAATASDSGTGGVGGLFSYTDTSKNWTVNQWAGATLTIGAESWTITSNTVDTLTVAADLTGKGASYSLASGDSATFPTTVWLQFAYESESHITFTKDTGLSPIRWRTIEKPEYIYKAKKEPYFTFSATGTPTLHSGSSVSVIQDDSLASGVMDAWATQRLNESKNPREVWEIVLPRFDLYYEIGDRYQDNYRLTDANIYGIDYDLVNYDTSLTIGDV